jgi:hypothetical protein
MYISPEISRHRIAQGNCYKCNADLKTHKRCLICNLYLLCDKNILYCEDCEWAGVSKKLQRKKHHALGGNKRKGFSKYKIKLAIIIKDTIIKQAWCVPHDVTFLRP